MCSACNSMACHKTEILWHAGVTALTQAFRRLSSDEKKLVEKIDTEKRKEYPARAHSNSGKSGTALALWSAGSVSGPPGLVSSCCVMSPSAINSFICLYACKRLMTRVYPPQTARRCCMQTCMCSEPGIFLFDYHRDLHMPSIQAKAVLCRTMMMMMETTGWPCSLRGSLRPRQSSASDHKRCSG